ncbi:MAG TPA: hypothetical protein VK084_09275 [Chitinophagaceae bacterium]|nr:hypothetical protein [Chitinophagaceae bacterium]
MKKIQNTSLFMLFLALGMFAMTSCSNSSKKAQNGSSESQDQFQSQVNQFDSSWNQRVQALNESIAKWDSSAKEHKGVMKERMELKIEKIESKRDSLVQFLKKSKNQTEQEWNGFQKKVADKYKGVVKSINDLSQQ